MSGILVISAIVAIAILWSRVKMLEQRITTLEYQIPEPAAEVSNTLSTDSSCRPQVVSVSAVHSTRKIEPIEEAAEADPLPPTWQTETRPGEADDDGPREQPRKIEFEELFGSRLPIWAGGITLAVAGLFIVKYSIDAGLLSPAVRVILALLFSIALIAGAEVARRWKQTAIDPRIAQAMAGAGIASAYLSILIAANLYHLIAPFTGFVGLALTTAAALGLALRFGSPAAVLGLIGGLAAPALVGEPTSNIAPLTAYLTLVVVGLARVGRRQRWPWLTVSALIGGFGWGFALIAFKTLDGSNTGALGCYALLLALAIPVLLGGAENDRVMRAAAAIMGAIQIAFIVVQGGYGPLDWGFYGLLSAAVIILTRIDEKLAMLPPVALGIGLVTMLSWPNPSGIMLAVVSGGGILLFAGSALAMIWSARGSLGDAIQAAVALGGTLAVACAKAPLHLLTNEQWSWLSLVASLPLIISAAVGARRSLPYRDSRFLTLGVAAAILCCVAMPELFDVRALPAIYALGIAVLAELWHRRPDLDYRGALAVALLATAAAMAEAFVRWLGGTLLTLTGEPLFVFTVPTPQHAVTDLLIPAIILAIGTYRIRPLVPTTVMHAALTGACAIAAAALFILYKQVFAIDSGVRFMSNGFLERVLLDQILFVAGWFALARQDRFPGLRIFGLAATSLALVRTVLYNALLFDPLWRDQLVGAAPLANMLAPAFLLPLAWLMLAARAEPEWSARFKPAMTATQMTLITLFAAATLRQAFHGSLLSVGGVSPGEDISRSLAAIALALGFLRWGIFKRERPWRIASLGLMLIAVIKVFVVDTSGLEGLMRIGSFVALGFSLIGIGWLYSRHLKSDAPLTSE